MEDVLNKARRGELQITPDVMDVVLESIDMMKGLLNAIRDTGSDKCEIEIDEITRRLQGISQGENIVESTEKKADSAPKITESKKAESKKADSTKSHNPPKKSAKFTPYKIDGKSIFIAYNGRIKRHFVMQNPYRIVMDFEINKKFYKQNRYTLNSPHFKRLKYGLHTKFLRIVLEMNGSYIYELGVREDGVQINVK